MAVSEIVLRSGALRAEILGQRVQQLRDPRLRVWVGSPSSLRMASAFRNVPRLTPGGSASAGSGGSL
nr:hypothetical protein [Saccharopolyspora pogona]